MMAAETAASVSPHLLVYLALQWMLILISHRHFEFLKKRGTTNHGYLRPGMFMGLRFSG